MEYEYVGFRFLINEDFKPVEGQHRAAYKEKHRRNARAIYNQEKKMREGNRD